ncbi:MAG TPA: aminodeoxychorismate lyase [Steroidobacteraceae bacterium]|nr:aminodeoxychorismate lyase [Steroidobacteraceae bacterium]
MSLILVNGEEGGAIDPRDRGLLYGDGLFETIAVSAGRPRFLDWHLERLGRGARALRFPELDFSALRADIARAAAADRGVVKLIVTRGPGERGYRPPREPRPTRIVMALPWPSWPAHAAGRGARLGWCKSRYARNAQLAGLKHLNRLEQVLARAEWDDADMDEGLMLDDRGLVISATQANLLARIGGQWVTPRLDECGVAGVMRRAFGEWSAGRGSVIEERALNVADVRAAESLILTNALIGAWPVATLDGRPLAVDPAARAFNEWIDRA